MQSFLMFINLLSYIIYIQRKKESGMKKQRDPIKDRELLEELHPAGFLQDILKCLGILVLASMIGFLFKHLGFAESNIIMIYVLAVLLISVVTVSPLYSFIASLVAVLVFNFLFTEPTFSLRAYDQGYPVTFIVMFLAALLTGGLAARLKNSAKISRQSAYRTQQLLELNQMLQKAQDAKEIIQVTGKQMLQLTGKNILIYQGQDITLQDPDYFSVDGQPIEKSCLSSPEKLAACWAYEHNDHAGATTPIYPECRCLYLAIRVNRTVYGVVGIEVQDQILDNFELNLLYSMLGECGMALENYKNAKEKEEAAVLARNQQLQTNLLRSISHDLRTPLTSISGNASNLLSNGYSFDEQTKQNLYMDIYDDSMWLISLVENLLSVTRLEEGKLNLNMSEDLIEDAIDEALRHVNRKSVEHHIVRECEDELLLAKMDARLIVQVIINIVDNAIKYTQKGSTITISTRRKGKFAEVKISDDGPGISDEMKSRIFDMFFCGANKIADSHRSLGLGLALCRSIIHAHGGSISVSDHQPKGTVFTFTLPVGEVQLHE